MSCQRALAILTLVCGVIERKLFLIISSFRFLLLCLALLTCFATSSTGSFAYGKVQFLQD